MTTRVHFASMCLLASVGIVRTGARRALCAWSIAESGTEPCNGHPNQGADFNLWNTILPLPGSTFYNHLSFDTGVQNYASAAQGARAFSKTLHGDTRYATLLEVLARAYVSPKTVLAAIDASPWGTHEPLLSEVFARYNADPRLINLLPVGSA